jgi:hypothetical protein
VDGADATIQIVCELLTLVARNNLPPVIYRFHYRRPIAFLPPSPADTAGSDLSFVVPIRFAAH